MQLLPWHARSRRPRRHARLCAATPALLLGLVCTAASAEEPDLGWLDRDAIARGEVVFYSERAERPQIVVVKSATEIDAPAEAIWSILKDCQTAPEYVPNVVSCRSIEVVDAGRAELFIQTVKPAFFVPSFEHVFRLEYWPYSHIDLHRVSGPIALMEGAWWLVPQPTGKILLVYELKLDPGMPIPRFFVRATLKRDLPKVLAAVRERSEAKR